MSSSPRRLLVGLTVTVAAVLVIALAVRARSATRDPRAAASSHAGPRVVPVTTVKASRRDVPVWLEGLGNVAAWQQVTVRPQVDGRLERVYFTEGQRVHRGQPLAQIDPRPFEAQLAQAQGALARDRAQLKGAQANLTRYQTLVKKNLIAQQQADDQAALVGQYEGAVRADQAAVQTAQLNLDFAHITAPIDGVVGVRLVDAGNLVRATDATGLVVITQMDPVSMFVTLPEDALPELTAAMKRGDVACEAWSRDRQSRLGQGTLFVIDNQINTATATLRLKCRLPNPDRKLWPNLFVKARLLVDTRKDATVVPPSAVQRGPQGTFVYVVEGGKAEVRQVTVGLQTEDWAVIDKGLSAGDAVVLEGQAQLREGAPVQARPAAPEGQNGGQHGQGEKSHAPSSAGSAGKGPA